MHLSPVRLGHRRVEVGHRLAPAPKRSEAPPSPHAALDLDAWIVRKLRHEESADVERVFEPTEPLEDLVAGYKMCSAGSGG